MKNKPLTILLAMLMLAILLVLADDMEPPVPVRTVNPKYPIEMRREGVSGLVTINCLIDEKGDVSEPNVVKTTNEAFREPAIEALKKWKFKPAKKNGTAIPLRVTIPIKFSADD